jgi:hypothetical protein
VRGQFAQAITGKLLFFRFSQTLRIDRRDGRTIHVEIVETRTTSLGAGPSGFGGVRGVDADSRCNSPLTCG